MMPGLSLNREHTEMMFMHEVVSAERGSDESGTICCEAYKVSV